MVNKKEVIGEYTISRNSRGGFTAYDKNRAKRYCPPDEELRRMYDEQIRSGKPGLTNYLKDLLRTRSIIVNGSRSIPVGKKALGIEGPFIKTKRGVVRTSIRVPDAEIEKAIRECWPKEVVERILAGEEVSINNIDEFNKTYERESGAAYKRPGRLKGFVERIYPGLFRLVSKVNAAEIDIKQVEEELTKRSNLGLPISEWALRSSPDMQERRLCREIRTLSKNPRGSLLASGYKEMIKQLIGNQECLEQGRGVRKSLANMTEELVYFFLLWSKITKLGFRKIPKGKLTRNGSGRRFTDGVEKYIADFRINDQALEVKSGLGRITNAEIEDILKKYTPKKNKWLTGEKIGGSTVLFHTRPQLYLPHSDTLTNAGIQIVDYNWFSERLEALIKEMKEHHKRELGDVKPRVHDLDSVLELNEELALRPCLLMRSNNIVRRNWSMELLKGLVKKALEIENGN